MHEDSYLIEHMKKVKHKKKKPSVMVDRAAYLNFLEGKLGEVSAVSLKSENLELKIEQLQQRVQCLEDGLVVATKTLREYQEASQEMSDFYRKEREIMTAEWEHRLDSLREEYEERMRRQQKLIEDYTLRVNAHIHNSKLHNNMSGQKQQQEQSHQQQQQQQHYCCEKNGNFESESGKPVNLGMPQISAAEIECMLQELFDSVRSDVEKQVRNSMESAMKYMVCEQVQQCLSDGNYVRKDELDKLEQTIIQKVEAVEGVAQKLCEQFDSIADIKTEDVEREAKNAAQIARDVRRNVDDQLRVMKAEIMLELEKLQQLRQEIIHLRESANRARQHGDGDDGCDTNGDSDIDSMGEELSSNEHHHERRHLNDNHNATSNTVDPVLEEKLWDMQKELKSMLMEHQRDQQEKILALIKDKNELTNMTATILQHLMESNPKEHQSRRDNSQGMGAAAAAATTAERSSKMYNIPENCEWASSDASRRQRKKQLKELYKKIQMLELEQFAEARLEQKRQQQLEQKHKQRQKNGQVQL